MNRQIQLTSPTISRWRNPAQTRQRERFNFRRVAAVERPRPKTPSFWQRAGQFVLGGELHSMIRTGVQSFNRQIELRSRLMETRLETQIRAETPPFDFGLDLMPLLIIGGIIGGVIIFVKK